MSFDRLKFRAAIVGNDVKLALESIADALDALDAGAVIDATPGTSQASKALVLGTNKETDTIALPVGGLSIGAGAGTAVTASAAEMNALTDAPASVTTTATPAAGTCGVQFVFKNAGGSAIAHAIAGTAYFSDATGAAIAAATSGATLTNGMWLDVVAGKMAIFSSTAAGLLGATVTAGAGTYYISFVLPDGKIVTSSALTVN